MKAETKRYDTIEHVFCLMEHTLYTTHGGDTLNESKNEQTKRASSHTTVTVAERTKRSGTTITKGTDDSNTNELKSTQVKKLGRPKGSKNSKPLDREKPNNPRGIGPFGPGMINIDSGDNDKILQANMRIYALPPIKITDPPSVNTRIMEFFQIYADADLKPTVAGLAMALGIDRRRLWEIKVGQEPFGVTPEITDCVRKAYMVLENMWESYMNSGKINPVSGIFLGKNHFGYQDKMEYVVTPNAQNETAYSADDLMKRYALDDGTTIESTVSDVTVD